MLDNKNMLKSFRMNAVEPEGRGVDEHLDCYEALSREINLSILYALKKEGPILFESLEEKVNESREKELPGALKELKYNDFVECKVKYTDEGTKRSYRLTEFGEKMLNNFLQTIKSS